MINKPMLAASLKDLGDVIFPVLVTPKLDGIRCIIKNGVALSRNFIAIPNNHVQSKVKDLPDNLDGELMIEGDFNSVQSAIMREDGEPDFTYNVFDYVGQSLGNTYVERIITLKKLKLPSFCKLVLPVEINNEKELSKIENQYISEGYEGVMIRSLNGPYKCGRATIREGYLSKLKRFEDSEAEIIGFVEQMHNDNVAEEDNFGRTKRSSHKSNMKGKDTLGAIQVRDIKNNIEFEIGTGFNDALRKEIWDNKDKYLGKIVTYQYQGIVEKPRFPSFKGFRDKRDI